MRDHLNLSGLPLWTVFVVFSGSALVILITGAKLTRVADRLADLTGIGEAMFGAVLLGATTSLPGIVTSVYTASAGFAQLSVSNAVGGIAAQTAFLAVADITYRRANLEHAAASIENLVQAALLMTLLALPLLAMAGPEKRFLSAYRLLFLRVEQWPRRNEAQEDRRKFRGCLRAHASINNRGPDESRYALASG